MKKKLEKWSSSYSERDLVLFGNYLLAKMQLELKDSDSSGTYSVTPADLENWKEERKKYLLEYKKISPQ